MKQYFLIVQISKAVIAAYSVATCTAALAILLWTQALETIGAGLLVPLYVAPAIVGYALAGVWPRFQLWRRFIYSVLMIPVPVGLLWVVVFPSEGARMDGADEMALAFLITLVPAGIAAFVTVELWHTKPSNAHDSQKAIGSQGPPR